MLTHEVVEDKERVQTAVKEPLRPIVVRPPAPIPTIRYADLFADILLETGGGQRKRRTWATISSFILQCLLIGVLISVPLWFTDSLPTQQLVTFLEAPPPPPPPPPAAAASAVVKAVKVASEMVNGQLRTPSRIPVRVEMIKEDEAPPAITGGIPGGVPGGIPGGQLGGVIGGILRSSSTPAAVPKLVTPTPTVQRVRVSQGVTQGMLIYRPEPPYPRLAQQARVQGVVVLRAIIAKDGTIQNLQFVSGHPLLSLAAINAVKQWRYKPYLLNGQPVEVETTVTVNFALQM